MSNIYRRMISVTKCLVLFCFLVVDVHASFVNISTSTVEPNFLVYDYLSDGETERRFHFNGTIGKEIAATYEANGTRNGITLRQVTDRHHMIQLIYDADNNLQDCEFNSDREESDRFWHNFMREYHQLSSGKHRRFRNITMQNLEKSSDIPHDLMVLLNYPKLKIQCKKLHKAIRKAAHSSKTPDSRSKRDLAIFPGTRWCGDGHRSSKYSDLGAEQAVDRCCRRHDLCPYTIRGSETNFEFTNKRPTTISLCDCDERFRSCLKQANTAASNLVGNIFFNIIRTKCFTLKAEKVCKRTSWWGKCQQHEWKKKAHLRDPLPY